MCGSPLGDAGGTCSPATSSAPIVTQTCVTGTPPTQTGGTVADGTYYVTTSQNYDCGDAGPEPAIAVTYIVSGGCFTIVFTEPVGDAGTETLTTTGTVSFSGTTITTQAFCPTIQPVASDTTYSVSGTTVTTLENNVLLTLVKQ